MLIFTTNEALMVLKDDKTGKDATLAPLDISEMIGRKLKAGEKITVRELYNYLNYPLPSTWYSTELYGVDPDEWGWDENGYRQLYRTRIIREEL